MAQRVPSVLVVDDDAEVRGCFREILVRAGHCAFVAEDGATAIRMLAREAIEIVLLDVFMPDRDGLDTLREIKSSFPEVRVIVISGGGIRGRYEFLDVALRLGADSILRKPISTDELLSHLRSRQ